VSELEIEGERIERQAVLDAERTATERNASGQFATPYTLADDITKYTLTLHGQEEVDFLEPACGSGAFFSALLRSIRSERLREAVGIELDPRFAKVAGELWSDHGLKVVEGDFTEIANRSEYRASLLLTNPPYVRHHHLGREQKQVLVAKTAQQLRLKPSGLSGLYVYFMLLSHRLLAPDPVSAWLIPSEFMDVNYGTVLREYLTSYVTLMRIHRFDPVDVQFEDALVTSAVVVFKNASPTPDRRVEFTQGGSVQEPRTRRLVPASQLRPVAKWSSYFRLHAQSSDPNGRTLEAFFRIRRGIATGANEFFIIPKAAAMELGIRSEHLKPMLPSPRHLPSATIEADANGWPLIAKPMVLLDCALSPARIAEVDPALKTYLSSAGEEVRNRYLVRKRDPWYRQEQRLPAPFLCTYMGRGVDEKRPFRFVHNKSRAVASNLYLMLYPTPLLQCYIDIDPEALSKIHRALLSLTAEDLRNGGRVYGGGLHKIEPKELAALDATVLIELAPELLRQSVENEQLTFDAGSPLRNST